MCPAALRCPDVLAVSDQVIVDYDKIVVAGTNHLMPTADKIGASLLHQGSRRGQGGKDQLIQAKKETPVRRVTLDRTGSLS